MTQKDKIDTLIEKEKPNSVFWHFLTGMWYRYFVFGNRISSNKYIIWTSDRYTGSSHPIFNIDFDSKGKIINIKSDKNPFHRMFSKFTVPFFIIFLIIISGIHYMEYDDIFVSIFIFLFFGVILGLIFISSKKHYKKQEEFLKKELLLRIEEISKENN